MPAIAADTQPVLTFIVQCEEANVVYSVMQMRLSYVYCIVRLQILFIVHRKDSKAGTRPVANHFENQRLQFAGSGVSEIMTLQKKGVDSTKSSKANLK